MAERIIRFGEGNNLVGILNEVSSQSADNPIIIFLNAGAIHRVGPNRLYTKLSRIYATLGFSSLRFDLSGIGDSVSSNSEFSYNEYAIKETQQAMDLISKNLGVNEFILTGICTGGDIALKVSFRDKRVVGINAANAIYFDREQQMLISQLDGSDEKNRNILNELQRPLLKLIENKLKLFLIYAKDSFRHGLIKSVIHEKLTDLHNENKLIYRTFSGVDYILSPLWIQEEYTSASVKWVEQNFYRK